MVDYSLIVTTTKTLSPALEERARRIAEELHTVYRPRRDDNLATITAGAARVIVLGSDQVHLRDPEAGREYTFHPNMVSVRAFNRQRGARDLFLEAMALEAGNDVLDCTLGFGAEATLAALEVGKSGQVTGLESVPELAAVTREGLRTFPMPPRQILEAMRRVKVVTADYREFLPRCTDGSYDVVYFDPFFAERLPGSEPSVSPLAYFGNAEPLDAGSMQEAQRVARRRVVVKHPRYAPLPDSIASLIARTVTARRSRLAFSIIEAVPRS